MNLLLSIVIAVLGLGFCNRSSSETESTSVCENFFEHDRIRLELVKDYSFPDLIALEKCGFSFHPRISFYEEIVQKQDNPIPFLLQELAKSNNDAWSSHMVYLIRESIESRRFLTEVKSAQGEILDQVNRAMGKIKNKEIREKVRDQRDGIEMFLDKE